MIWFSIGLLSLIALAPAALTLRGRVRTIRDERSTALALHEAQLAEVDRDLAIGLIAPAEHDVALLEIQRRILSADAAPSTARARSSAMLGWFALAATPALAVTLYLTNGAPDLPAQPLGPRLVAQHLQNRKTDALIAQLQQAVSALPADDPNRRQGYLLLGQLQASGDHYAQAAEAWGHALELGFDPELAARTAEAMTRAEHHVSAQALELFRKALDAAPKDAGWRAAVQGRIAQGEHEQENP